MATVSQAVRKSLFRFSEVEAKQASPLTLNTLVKDVLRANNDACYVEMEKYLLPPGISGSKSFDQAYAVSVLLQHDSDNGGRIATVMDSQNLSRRLLWDRLQSVLRNVGFKFAHGRMVGLLEHHVDRDTDKGDKGEENGQPDIE